MSLALRCQIVTIGSPSAGREVAAEVVSEIDSKAPLFFLSYARSRRERGGVGPTTEPSQQVIQFFDDLSVNVAELVSRRTGVDPGFIDRSITPGLRWSPELLEAVGKCQVFVVLLNAAYLECEWCAREWDAFSRREVTTWPDRSPSRQAGIVPVIWAPLREEAQPSAIRAIQRFSPTGLRIPDIAASYEKEGIFGLLQMGWHDHYTAIVWRLAQRIADIYYNHRVEPATFEYAELRSSFLE